MRCPCRKKSESIDYLDCCGPYHHGLMLPPTAETLMRSRYAAFVRQDAAYLDITWHPSTRPAHVTCDPGQEWLLLRVLATETDGDTARVEFVARSRLGGRMLEQHEISRFVRENGRWLYVTGILR